MKIRLIKIFRIITLLEGLSYILLLIAMPIKYLLHNEKYVQMLGMPHGVLFLLYVLLAFYFYRKMKWHIKDLIIILICSIIPLGTFYVDYKYLS